MYHLDTIFQIFFILNRRELYIIFTQKEYSLINSSYFRIIRETENYLEFQSKNTKHCWIIQKHSFESSKKHPIFIYHKHWECYTVFQAIESIKGHDKYVLDYNYH